MVERLPTPFGLVRSGVAPDHADTKNVVNEFNSIASDPRFSFFGNVSVGPDVSVAQLLAAYDRVVLAFGAGQSRLNVLRHESAASLTVFRQTRSRSSVSSGRICRTCSRRVPSSIGTMDTRTTASSRSASTAPAPSSSGS